MLRAWRHRHFSSLHQQPTINGIDYSETHGTCGKNLKKQNKKTNETFQGLCK